MLADSCCTPPASSGRGRIVYVMLCDMGGEPHGGIHPMTGAACRASVREARYLGHELPVWRTSQQTGEAPFSAVLAASALHVDKDVLPCS